MADSSTVPPITLSHRHVFGLKADVRCNVHYAEETQIIYPAGASAVLWLADQKQQKFFHGFEGAEGITCLAVNATKRYLAVAEKCQEGALVTIFDLVTGKKRKTLAMTETAEGGGDGIDCPEFVSIAFSSDNKYLLTMTGTSLGGQHDWTLIYWVWDKARALAKRQVSPSGAAIRECSFNPTDSANVCVVGDGILSFYKLKENELMSVPTPPAQLSNILCHAWLLEDKLLVCTESGELQLFTATGELSCVLAASPKVHRSATCAVSFSKGFITGGDDGYIRVYEQSDDPKEVFKRVKNIQLDGGSSGTGVRSLALSPSEEVLAVTTSTAQLHQLSLLGQDLLKAEESPVFEPVLTPFHSGAILGMDVCTRKPLVVTCGVDKSVRVWNYIDKTCELCKFFNEEAYSVAFHPSGFHLIIGFSDKLRLMNLLMEDMRTYRDIPIKQCRECRFSNGGQYFAAVSSSSAAHPTIQVYKTYTCEVVETLRGHNNKVRSIAWTADDSTIVSTGMDGAVYEYNLLAEGRRSQTDFVLKGTMFSCVIVHTDPSTGSNTMYVVGNDKTLKEVSGGQCQNSVESQLTLGQIVLSNSAKTLFAAVAHPDAQAPIRCYKFPLDGYYTEYACHSAQCNRIRITFDDYYLFTCSDDGCLFIFDVRKKDRVVSKRDKENALTWADEILVTRTHLDEKQAQLQELERQVEELSNQIDFQLRHRESYHKEEMSELEEKYTQEIDQERTKHELLREEKNDSEMEAEDNIKSLMELHAKQTQDLEGSFQQQMMQKVGEYQELAARREAVHREWEMQHRQLMERHARQVAEMQREFGDKQAQDQQAIKRIQEEKALAEKVHEETMRQLEQDTDREIEELKDEKEARLQAEQADKVRLRGQSGISKRHHEELRRQMQKKEEELRHHQEEARKKQEKIDSLKHTSQLNLNLIRERDKMIEHKEEKIYELKKQNQDLEKFKFVLDYKIKELKAQIDPKNDSIAEMKRQIQAMDADLEDYHRKNKQLQLSIEQLHVKQRGLQEEIVTQRKKMTDCQTIIKRFKTDLHECVQFMQEPRQLKESVVNLHKKYTPNGIKKQELDQDIQREYNQQREYLEKSVDSLRRKLLKDSDVHRQDNTRILQENVALIREINELRREIDFLKWKRNQQKLNVNSKKGATSTGKLKETGDLATTNAEVEANKTHIDDLKRRIEEHKRSRDFSTAALPGLDAASTGAGTGRELGDQQAV
jgi:WD40 repeat protein